MKKAGRPICSAGWILPMQTCISKNCGEGRGTFSRFTIKIIYMKYFLFLVCACLLLSCGGGKVPKGILPPQQMQTIVWQLMQTDEFTANAFTRDSTKNLH